MFVKRSQHSHNADSVVRPAWHTSARSVLRSLTVPCCVGAKFRILEVGEVLGRFLVRRGVSDRYKDLYAVF